LITFFCAQNILVAWWT